ncbi:MAG: toxin [Desulfuromonas sp.]|nr:MAG: toxin [Desulfuromonas sp.]
MPEQTFLYNPTCDFTSKLEKIKKQDPPGYNRIVQVIDRLLENPGDADGKMHGVYHGRLKKYVGRSNYRLIYHWCKTCRKENKKQEDRCSNCDSIPDHSVIFFDVHHKNRQNNLKNS